MTAEGSNRTADSACTADLSLRRDDADEIEMSRNRIAVAALGATLALGLTPAGARAAVVSQPFTTTGEQQFVVPPGVTSVQVELVGGYGGSGNAGIPGGIPATDTATLTVSPGETLYAEVAGNGQSATGTTNDGGYGGGGDGAIRAFLFGSAPTGGGGGGASDVQRCPINATNAECGGHSALSSRLLVAGGGGGGGGNGLDPSSTAGGDGGSADQSGAPGAHDSWTDAGGGGGSRATSAVGGAAGASGQCEPSGNGCAMAGVLGQGGAGAEADGGGGGGGIFGGGGGGAGEFSNAGTPQNPVLANGGGGGGGGGSSGVVLGAMGVSGFSLLPTAVEAQPAVTFSWTPPPPAVITTAASAVTATTATLNGTINPNAWQPTGCSFSISPAPSGVSTFPCAQQLAVGGTPAAVSATALGLTPDTTYTVALTAVTVQGSSSGGTVTFTTPTQPNGSASSAGGNKAGPVISALTLSPRRFRGGTHAATIAKHAHKRAPTGTTISFTLSQPATVTLTFQRAQPGMSSGTRCLAPPRMGRHGRHCTRYTTVHGSVSIAAAPAGGDHISFDGLLAGGAKLAPGSYRVVLSASDANGTTAAAQHPAFTLLG